MRSSSVESTRNENCLHIEYSPTDDLAIIENKATPELAKRIKYKRILELQTGLHGSAAVKPRPIFRDLFAELASEKIGFDNNAGNWASAFKHVVSTERYAHMIAELKSEAVKKLQI